MSNNPCINTECPYNDYTSETGCTADLSYWEDCTIAEFKEEDEDDE